MKTNQKITLLSFVLSIFLFSCGAGSSSENKASYGGDMVVETSEEYYNEPDDYTMNSEDQILDEKTNLKQKTNPTNQSNQPEEPKDELNLDDIGQKLIKTAIIECELDDYKKTRAEISKAIKKWNGYIDDESEQNSDYRIYNSLKIRVPVDKFDSLVVDLIKGEKNVKSKQITVQDVTSQYIDVYSRLYNKKKEEEQYLKILEKAYTVDDILKVNNYIYAIREEIEATERQLKHLEKESSFSTIYLTIYQNFEVNPDRKFRFFKKVGNGLAEGWYGLLTFFVALAYLWPLVLIILIIAGIIVYKVKKRRKNKN